MLNLILGSAGLTYILINSELFEKLNLSCYMCVGFWSGVMMGIMLSSPYEHTIVNGCIGSLASNLTGLIVSILQMKVLDAGDTKG